MKHFLCGLLICLMIISQGMFTFAESKIQDITVYEAASKIGECRGQVSLVMIYNSGCSICQRAFPQFINIANRYLNRDVKVLAFSVDKYPENLEEYISGSSLPFTVYRIIPWQPGELDKAMGDLGIKIGKTFTTPVVAIINNNGQVIAQGQGVGDLSEVGQYLDYGLSN